MKRHDHGPGISDIRFCSARFIDSFLSATADLILESVKLIGFRCGQPSSRFCSDVVYAVLSSNSCRDYSATPPTAGVRPVLKSWLDCALAFAVRKVLR